MINNDFHIIGTAITNYVQYTKKNNHTSYYIRVEVEKMGSRKGEVVTMQFQVYSGNKNINFDEEIEGSQVVISGYLDSFLTEKGNYFVNPVVTDIYVVNKSEYKSISSEDFEIEWEPTLSIR